MSAIGYVYFSDGGEFKGILATFSIVGILALCLGERFHRCTCVLVC